MKYKLLIETVYRTFQEIEVDAERYPDDLFDDVELTDVTRAQKAMQYEANREEDEIYTDVFCERLESEGPDGFYHKVTLVDDTGRVVQDLLHDESDQDTARPLS